MEGHTPNGVGDSKPTLDLDMSSIGDAEDIIATSQMLWRGISQTILSTAPPSPPPQPPTPTQSQPRPTPNPPTQPTNHTRSPPPLPPTPPLPQPPTSHISFTADVDDASPAYPWYTTIHHGDTYPYPYPDVKECYVEDVLLLINRNAHIELELARNSIPCTDLHTPINSHP